MLSTADFSWTKRNGEYTGAAEASTLQIDKHLERAYPDACDVGFRLVSEHTGREVMMVLTHAQWNDNELVFETYQPVKGSKVDKPFCIIVFND